MIVDGMAEVQSLDKPEWIKNCRDLAEHFTNRLLVKYNQKTGLIRRPMATGLIRRPMATELSQSLPRDCGMLCPFR